MCFFDKRNCKGWHPPYPPPPSCGPNFGKEGVLDLRNTPGVSGNSRLPYKFLGIPPPPSGSPFDRLTVGSSHHLWLSFTPLDPVGKKIRQIRGISSVAIKKSRAITTIEVVKVVLLRAWQLKVRRLDKSGAYQVAIKIAPGSPLVPQARNHHYPWRLNS